MSKIEVRSRRSTAADRHRLRAFPAGDGPVGGLRVLARVPWIAPASLAAGIAVLVVCAVAVSPARSAAAQDSGSTPDAAVKLTSARFDLGAETAGAVADVGGGPLSAAGAVGEARYHSLMISDGGRRVPVIPRSGSVTAAVAPGYASAVAVEINGQRVGHVNDDFAGALADAVSSSSAHRFAGLGVADGGGPVAIDLVYTPPLDANDYLLVQEVAGDAAVDVTAIDAAGDPVGSTVRVGPGYQWNTGHGPSTGETSWASAIAVRELQVGAASIHGLRVGGSGAEVKVIALAAAPVAEVALDQQPQDQAAVSPPATPEQPAAPEQPVGADGAAAIGLQASVRPAIAVEGAGCEAEAEADVVAGQAATFCYVVTNLGATDLVDVRFVDEQLGLADAALATAGGSEPLRPGDQAVYYYHSVVDQRPVDAVTTVTARSVAPTDGPPGPVAAASSAPGAVVPVSQPDGAQDDAAAAAIVETPPRSEASPDVAEVVEVAAPPAAGPVAAATDAVALTQLALTGMVTEPWVMVIFAMAFIFFGYTIYAAFQPDGDGGEPSGHDQLDALGFD